MHSKKSARFCPGNLAELWGGKQPSTSSCHAWHSGFVLLPTGIYCDLSHYPLLPNVNLLHTQIHMHVPTSCYSPIPAVLKIQRHASMHCTYKQCINHNHASTEHTWPHNSAWTYNILRICISIRPFLIRDRLCINADSEVVKLDDRIDMTIHGR